MNLENLPAEIILQVAECLERPQITRLAACCRKLEWVLGNKTWDKVCLHLRAVRTSERLNGPCKHITGQDLDKFYYMIQNESVQSCVKNILISVDKTSFEYAKCKDAFLPVELGNPSPLDQLLLHMIPALCSNLERIQINLPCAMIPIQLQTMIARLQKHVEVELVLDEPQRGFRARFKKNKNHGQVEDRSKPAYKTGPNLVSSLTVECSRLDTKQLTRLVRNFDNLKALSIISPSANITSLQWVPQSVAHLQFETYTPFDVKRGHECTLPNLRSIHVTGKWPSLEHVATPNLRIVWVGQVTLEVAEFIRKRNITDVIVSSDLSMPLVVASDSQNLCPKVKTLVLYGITFGSTLLGFLKLFPNMGQVLCYLGSHFEMEKDKFKQVMLKNMERVQSIRAIYVCAPNWSYRNHEVRQGKKRLVLLTQREFFKKFGYSAFGKFL